MADRYEGNPAFEWLPDGRHMKLLNDFTYYDPSDEAWPVPAGAQVDGASIPRLLWTVIGGPFAGAYRNASVIHDWYCDIRSRPWKSVHKMFYNAMKTSGVAELQAKIMFAGVYYKGPRWNETVVSNQALARGNKKSGGFDIDAVRAPGPSRSRPAMEEAEALEEMDLPMAAGDSDFGEFADVLRGESRLVQVYEYDMADEELSDLLKKVEAEDMDVDSLESMMDEALAKKSVSVTKEYIDPI